MPFSRKLLNEGEDVVLDLHPHWEYFVKQATALIVAVLLSRIGDWRMAAILLAVSPGLTTTCPLPMPIVSTGFDLAAGALANGAGRTERAGEAVPGIASLAGEAAIPAPGVGARGMTAAPDSTGLMPARSLGGSKSMV